MSQQLLIRLLEQQQQLGEQEVEGTRQVASGLRCRGPRSRGAGRHSQRWSCDR
jgi:hypothetical protein